AAAGKALVARELRVRRRDRSTASGYPAEAGNFLVEQASHRATEAGARGRAPAERMTSCLNDKSHAERNAAMLMRTMRLSLMVLAALLLTAGQAWGIGEVLGQTKEELKLKYDVAVEQHVFDERGTGRVTVTLTLADEGRLKPLDEVQL